MVADRSSRVAQGIVGLDQGASLVEVGLQGPLPHVAGVDEQHGPVLLTQASQRLDIAGKSNQPAAIVVGHKLAVHVVAADDRYRDHVAAMRRTGCCAAGAQARPVHLTLVVDVDPHRAADLTVRRPHSANRDVLLADGRPGGRRNEADFLLVAFRLREYIGVMRGLVALDIQFDQPPGRAVAKLLCQRPTAVEDGLLEIDQPAQTQLEG